MGLFLLAAAVALAAQPAVSHHRAGHAPAAKRAPHPSEPAVRVILSQYKSAIERLDATGTESLFAADSAIFENGGVEGNYVDYLGHHLGPELKAFKSFKFSDYKIAVRFEGPLAIATETYNYRIVTAKDEVVERRGVATSVLKKIAGRWKILSMHNSSRKPKVG
ncbi:MAG TPA: nuclear transport factor 2 family protein [Sphingomicrobium sp.]|nr:nuclear transport factor 2 family protein [Sphingomicrobium sp.]